MRTYQKILIASFVVIGAISFASGSIIMFLLSSVAIIDLYLRYRTKNNRFSIPKLNNPPNPPYKPDYSVIDFSNGSTANLYKDHLMLFDPAGCNRCIWFNEVCTCNNNSALFLDAMKQPKFMVIINESSEYTLLYGFSYDTIQLNNGKLREE